jgi:hypothetical protein
MNEEYAEREEDLKGGEKGIRRFNRDLFIMLHTSGISK